LHDAQYIALVDQHPLGWKEEGKYSSGLLKDEKTREKMRGFTRGDNRGGTTHDSIVRNPMILPDVQVKRGMEHLFLLFPR